MGPAKEATINTRTIRRFYIFLYNRAALFREMAMNLRFSVVCSCFLTFFIILLSKYRCVLKKM